MVPSGVDTAPVKRNAEELMSDGKRKRKKKKQGDTPRPACSWVYFSRKFIKEYSASHPEASGLKAATKAASDAWKSMSHEEKEKYTRHAREVWDDYLSTAPGRVPKPRKQTKLVTRCSPGRLFNVLQRLTPEQRAAVKSMGFGSLLGLKCRTLRRSLCLWLLERFNTARRSLDICGECISLSPSDVELVMGLAANGKDVVNSGPDDLISELRHCYNATNHGISVRLLEERLAVPEAGENFKRSFVLYALGTLLSPTARLDVSPSFLHFLTNMDVIHQFNWGKFLLDRLVREVSRYRQGKQHAVGGCLLFLQLFYYESISIRGSAAVTPTVVPCLSSWGEEEITEREKRERELGGYGSGEVICKDKCLVMESEYIDRQDGHLLSKVSTEENDPGFEQVRDHVVSGEIAIEEVHIPNFLESQSVICGDIEEVVDSIRSFCRNKDYGCNETVDCIKNADHEVACIYAPCSCPILSCNFVGSSQQLSLHFSSRHWDSGRRFRYSNPLKISLRIDEEFLVLQAEEDGMLFLLNKGVIQNIGNTVMITCVSPRSSKVKYLYELVAERGISCRRVKSLTENFPSQVEEGFPLMDFLVIPSRYLGSFGELNLEACIWNSTDLVECD